MLKGSLSSQTSFKSKQAQLNCNNLLVITEDYDAIEEHEGKKNQIRTAVDMVDNYT